MVPGPARAADPLQMLRRPDHRVMRNRVAAGAVHEMRPFIDILRTWLDGFLPFSRDLCIDNTTGHKDAQRLLHADPCKILGHEEIDEIVDIGQPLTVKPVHRDISINPQRLDMAPGNSDIIPIPVESVHLVARTFAKRSRQLPIAASKMNNEPPIDTCGFNDRAGIGGLICPQRSGKKQRGNGNQEKRCTLAAEGESGEHRILHGELRPCGNRPGTRQPGPLHSLR